jgi:hypothetical protein
MIILIIWLYSHCQLISNHFGRRAFQALPGWTWNLYYTYTHTHTHTLSTITLDASAILLVPSLCYSSYLTVPCLDCCSTDSLHRPPLLFTSSLHTIITYIPLNCSFLTYLIKNIFVVLDLSYNLTSRSKH